MVSKINIPKVKSAIPQNMSAEWVEEALESQQARRCYPRRTGFVCTDDMDGDTFDDDPFGGSMVNHFDSEWWK